MVCHIIYLLKDLGSDTRRETILWAPRSYHAEPIRQTVNTTLESYTGGGKNETGSYDKGRFAANCEKHHQDGWLCQTQNLVLILSFPPNSINLQNRGEKM